MRGISFMWESAQSPLRALVTPDCKKSHIKISKPSFGKKLCDFLSVFMFLVVCSTVTLICERACVKAVVFDLSYLTVKGYGLRKSGCGDAHTLHTQWNDAVKDFAPHVSLLYLKNVWTTLESFTQWLPPRFRIRTCKKSFHHLDAVHHCFPFKSSNKDSCWTMSFFVEYLFTTLILTSYGHAST